MFYPAHLSATIILRSVIPFVCSTNSPHLELHLHMAHSIESFSVANYSYSPVTREPPTNFPMECLLAVYGCITYLLYWLISTVTVDKHYRIRTTH